MKILLNWESTKCTHLLWTNFFFCRFLKKRYLAPFRPEFQTPWRRDVLASIHPTCKTPECQGVKHSLVKVVVSQGGGKLQQPGIFYCAPLHFLCFPSSAKIFLVKKCLITSLTSWNVAEDNFHSFTFQEAEMNGYRQKWYLMLHKFYRFVKKAFSCWSGCK